MKLAKKIIFGVIIATAIFLIAGIFFKIYAPQDLLGETGKTYWIYLIFLYCSIITIYVYGTKHHRTRNILSVGIITANFIRLSSFFTENILGIGKVEFYALAGLCVVALLTAYIKFRIRYILILIISIPFTIILLNHVIPTYATAPDFTGFYASEKTILSVENNDSKETHQEAESKITLQYSIPNDNTLKERIFNLETDMVNTVIITETKIIFSAKTGVLNTFARITFPNGSIATLYPQSAAEINKYSINILQGTIGVYIPKDQSGTITITGALSGYKETPKETISKSIEQYISRRNNYFTTQIGGSIMLNATIDNAMKWYLSIARSTYSILGKIASILPQSTKLLGKEFEEKYTKNILNYNEFHKYLPYQIKTTYSETGGNTTEIMNETQKGYDKTNIKGRIESIKNTINSRFKKS